MDKFITIVLFKFCVVFAPFSSSEELCYSSRFQPRCLPNEMIIIREAYYGRKTLDNCLFDEGSPSEANLQDPNFVGCFTDVKNVISSQCAGKQECDVVIPDIKEHTSCYRYLKHYLLTTYDCIRVVTNNNHCQIKATSEKQHIYVTNLLSQDTACGSLMKPWIVESLAGQQINVSLETIVGDAAEFIKNSRSQCKMLGHVVDRSNKLKINICSSSGVSDKSSFYVSDSNSIEIIFEDRQKSTGFIIATEATGCSDLIPPADAWLKRTEDEAIIGCYSTRLRWQLKCIGRLWKGVIGNCSQGHEVGRMKDTNESKVEKSAYESQIVPIVAITMVGFVICFTIVCVGVVFLNRYYAMNKSKMMKQMAMGCNENGMTSAYNNGCIENSTLVDSAFDKGQINPVLKDLTMSNGNCGLIQDIAQYYELDKTYVK